MKKLLYVCEADSGGILEYAIRQTAAILHQGVEVHFLCLESFPRHRLAAGICVSHFPTAYPPFWAFGKLRAIWKLTIAQRRVSKTVCATFERGAFDALLFASYKEYFAAFWVGPLRKLARKGAVIGTIAHDPVRDFVVGPLWWHRWSVRLGYSFVRHVFVHDETPVDFGGRRPKVIEVHQIPHGAYPVSEPKIGRMEMRRRLGFSSGLTIEHTDGAAEGAGEPVSESPARPASAHASLPATIHPPPVSPDIVFLAFGQIRDGKNLDLFLRAMVQLPENVKLLVAGKGDSGSSKGPEFYQKLAEELGVAGRCRWDLREIPDEEVGDLFAACDAVLLIYSAKFRSASGVLNAAVSARKTVLASSGPGPLKNVVQKYRLGLFVEPDNIETIIKGALELLKLLASNFTEGLMGFQTDWNLYEKENSWYENAKKIRKHLIL